MLPNLVLQSTLNFNSSPRTQILTLLLPHPPRTSLHFPLQTTRTLRIFLSHTVSGQPWQTGGVPPENTNFETGEGIPAWSFRIEGRLLEVSEGE